jgi:uncharacterized membrane protein YfcA
VRSQINWRTAAPFILGSAVGVPGGTVLLTTVDATILRFSIGVLLVIFSLYGLFRPALRPVQSNVPIELSVGIVNGVIGGLTGLGGIAVTIWSQLRGGSKDEQRAVFQPVLFSTFAITAIALGVAGRFTAETFRLYAFALPALVVGLWAGLKLYGRLDDVMFRKIILSLLLVSGLSLILPIR